MKGFGKKFAIWFSVITSFSVSLASIVFMCLTFFTEGFLFHGMLFIEPNIWMARSEFGLTIFGFIGTFTLFFWALKKVERNAK